MHAHMQAGTHANTHTHTHARTHTHTNTHNDRIIGSKIVIYFDYISPCCDLDAEDNKPIFPHDTLPHDNTPLYQVG